MGSFFVFFDGQFWIGIATRGIEGDETGETARVVFGSQPSDAELLAWAYIAYRNLDFLPATTAHAIATRIENPKRRQREAARELESDRLRSAAQAAWHDALALRKATSPSSAIDRRARADERYRQRRAKRKMKHRGK